MFCFGRFIYFIYLRTLCAFCRFLHFQVSQKDKIMVISAIEFRMEELIVANRIADKTRHVFFFETKLRTHNSQVTLRLSYTQHNLQKSSWKQSSDSRFAKSFTGSRKRHRASSNVNLTSATASYHGVLFQIFVVPYLRYPLGDELTSSPPFTKFIALSKTTVLNVLTSVRAL